MWISGSNKIFLMHLTILVLRPQEFCPLDESGGDALWTNVFLPTAPVAWQAAAAAATAVQTETLTQSCANMTNKPSSSLLKSTNIFWFLFVFWEHKSPSLGSSWVASNRVCVRQMQTVNCSNTFPVPRFPRWTDRLKSTVCCVIVEAGCCDTHAVTLRNTNQECLQDRHTSTI